IGDRLPRQEWGAAYLAFAVPRVCSPPAMTADLRRDRYMFNLGTSLRLSSKLAGSALNGTSLAMADAHVASNGARNLEFEPSQWTSPTPWPESWAWNEHLAITRTTKPAICRACGLRRMGGVQGPRQDAARRGGRPKRWRASG